MINKPRPYGTELAEAVLDESESLVDHAQLNVDEFYSHHGRHLLSASLNMIAEHD